jgi:hypothetical protein
MSAFEATSCSSRCCTSDEEYVTVTDLVQRRDAIDAEISWAENEIARLQRLVNGLKFDRMVVELNLNE